MSMAENERRLHMQVLICGNYGYATNSINGQTIKTRVLRDALVGALGDAMVSVLDTASVLRNPFSFYSAAKRRFAQCTHVIILPGPRGVRVLLPLFLRWREKHHNDVRYVVIGGFLPDFLAKRRRLRELCTQLDGIYVETKSMADDIRALGLRNVHVLPNFRSFDRNMLRSYAPASRPLKLVFCARVFKEKGIEEAIAAVDCLNADLATPVVSIDIYGPVSESYKTHFNHLVEASPNSRYRGVLQTADLYSVLQQYDLVLFPTYYYGEGFPGTIVDAFIAGVPVLASDWGYNCELIEQGRTGAICSARSTEDLARTLRRYVEAPQLLAEMRQHCIDRAQRYHVDHALKGLLLDIAGGSRTALEGFLEPA